MTELVRLEVEDGIGTIRLGPPATCSMDGALCSAHNLSNTKRSSQSSESITTVS